MVHAQRDDVLACECGEPLQVSFAKRLLGGLKDRRVGLVDLQGEAAWGRMQRGEEHRGDPYDGQIHGLRNVQFHDDLDDVRMVHNSQDVDDGS